MTELSEEQTEALAAVKAASDDHWRAIEAAAAARERHHSAIEAALRVQARPADIERHSHYDRQHIDRIRRKAGIPARRRPTVQRIPRDTPPTGSPS